MKIHIKPNKVNKLKLKNTFIERVDSKPITKTMKVFFVIIQAVFFMDFGFILGNRRAIIIKKTLIFTLATVFCVGSTIGVFALHLEGFRLAWRLKVIIQHFIVIIILLFTRDINFCQFLEKLIAIDVKIELKCERFHLDLQIIAFFIICAVLKLILMEQSYVHYNRLSMQHSFAIEFLYLIMHVASDLPQIVLFFIFLSIYIRIKKLKQFLKRKIFFEDKVIGDKTIIAYSHRVYMTLVDLTESIKKTYDYVFLVSLIMNLPTILAVIYSAIKDIKSDTRDAFYTVELLMVLHIICIKFAPAIAAGSLSTAAHEIKVLLHNKLVEEKDPAKIGAIWKFLNYIDTRSFRLQVFTVVPLDASLPMKVLDLCCTYVIVLIQLTHLY